MSKENNAKEPVTQQRAPVTVGRVVHFFKETEDNKGGKRLVSYPMHVSDVNLPGNFQPKDQAIGGWLLQPPKRGGLEYKDGVMYSEKPMHNRWSWPQY